MKLWSRNGLSARAKLKIPSSRRIVAVDLPVVIFLPAGAEAGERARLGVETGAAAVEKEHDLGWVAPALPEGELAAVGTLAVAAGNDLLPRFIGGHGRGLRHRGRDRARIIVVAAARGNRGRQRGKQEQQRDEPACIRPETTRDEPPKHQARLGCSDARTSATGRRAPMRAGTAVRAATTKTVTGTTASSCQSGGSVVVASGRRKARCLPGCPGWRRRAREAPAPPRVLR